jgi:tRNA-binding protein
MQAIYNKNFGDVLIVQNWVNQVNSDIILSNEELTIFKDANAQISLNIYNWSKYNVEAQNVPATQNKINELLTKYDFELINLKPRTNFIVGQVIEAKKSEKSDKLNICQVDLGNQKVQIVCGGSNVVDGIKVVVATVGTIMPNGLVIKPGKLMGFESNGMICSAKELGIDMQTKPGEILVLQDQKVGTQFSIKE